MKQFAIVEFYLPDLHIRHGIRYRILTNPRAGVAFRRSHAFPVDFFLREFISVKPFRNRVPSTIACVVISVLLRSGESSCLQPQCSFSRVQTIH